MTLPIRSILLALLPMAPMVERYAQLIESEVVRDTRKLGTTDAFRSGTSGAANINASASTLKDFTNLRRAALLRH